MDVKSIFNLIKTKAVFGLNWLKENGEYKVMGIAAIVGLLTFSSWASFMLALLVGSVFYFAKKKIPASFTNMININVDKYVVNVIVGLVVASMFLFIV